MSAAKLRHYSGGAVVPPITTTGRSSTGSKR
nr:hypothetical protein [Klebsiella variicola]